MSTIVNGTSCWDGFEFRAGSKIMLVSTVNINVGTGAVDHRIGILYAGEAVSSCMEPQHLFLGRRNVSSSISLLFSFSSSSMKNNGKGSLVRWWLMFVVFSTLCALYF